MLINVTQEHIDNGQASKCTRCPVALAIRDCVKHTVGVWVDGFVICVGCAGGVFSPPAVKQFIEDFDHGRPVQPFSFEIDIPQELLKCSST